MNRCLCIFEVAESQHSSRTSVQTLAPATRRSSAKASGVSATMVSNISGRLTSASVPGFSIGRRSQSLTRSAVSDRSRQPEGGQRHIRPSGRRRTDQYGRRPYRRVDAAGCDFRLGGDEFAVLIQDPEALCDLDATAGRLFASLHPQALVELLRTPKGLGLLKRLSGSRPDAAIDLCRRGEVRRLSASAIT